MRPTLAPPGRDYDAAGGRRIRHGGADADVRADAQLARELQAAVSVIRPAARERQEATIAVAHGEPLHPPAAGTGGFWGSLTVPVPEEWVLQESREFPEALGIGTVIVQVYERAD